MDSITHSPIRGWLTTATVSGTVRTTAGWFTLAPDGVTICMRKIGGRNWYQYANTRRIIDFTADPTAK